MSDSRQGFFSSLLDKAADPDDDGVMLQTIFAGSGLLIGYWSGWKLIEAFLDRLGPDEAPARTWHQWAVGVIWFGAMLACTLIGLEMYYLLFPHHEEY